MCWRWLLLLPLLLPPPASAQESGCCAKASGSCRLACQQMSLVAAGADQQQLDADLRQMHKFCPQQMVPFWECLNETIQDLERGMKWWGRECCALGVSERCQMACARAASPEPLALNCRQSDEIDFFGCLTRHEAGDECCAPAHSAECHAACVTVFRSQRTPTRAAREAVLEACAERSPRVLQCVKNHTRLTPAHNTEKYLHCCETSESLRCGDTCRRALRTKTTHHEIVDALTDGGCGPPMHLTSDRVWTCLLQSGAGGSTRSSSAESRIDRTGIDGAKLHCCAQARSLACRRHCLNTFSNEWARLHDLFDRDCLAQPAEDRLARCLTDVEEPCELGCEGLNYCTNLNQRPTQLFRSCTSQADKAARFDVALWQTQGFIQLPGLSLPVLNVSQCQPDAWKAVACVLQIRPCHPHAHTSHICVEDCVALLEECVDASRLAPGVTAASLCRRLSPEGAPCLPLNLFSQPSTEWGTRELSAPCRGGPCNESEVCLVNRNCPQGKLCPQHTCAKGCRVGDVSQVVVPRGAFMRIPVSSGGKTCLKVCQCSARGAAERCVQLPCYSLDHCLLGSHKFEHGESWMFECNLCSCYAGEITCSKRHCSEVEGLPCMCPPVHAPVCGRNGNTYPSSCLARCAGLKDADFEFGPCSSQDPCESNPCAEGHRCVAARQVCLSLVGKTCPQHQCVDMRGSCSEAAFEPVCDADNQQHPNLCYLLRYNKRLAYKGKCLANCKWVGVVCGADGQSHLSECAALAARVGVDYEGPCVAVGRGGAAGGQCGDAVQCRSEGGATPPAACCPGGAAAVRMLLSAKQAARASLAAREAATVAAVVAALEALVPTAECRVLGHLSVEADLWVTLSPLPTRPTPLQEAACAAEAQKLAALVQSAAPRLAAHLPLSLLTAAAPVHLPPPTSHAQLAALPSALPLLLWLVAVCRHVA